MSIDDPTLEARLRADARQAVGDEGFVCAVLTKLPRTAPTPAPRLDTSTRLALGAGVAGSAVAALVTLGSPALRAAADAALMGQAPAAAASLLLPLAATVAGLFAWALRTE
jgi:hypothetical protein